MLNLPDSAGYHRGKRFLKIFSCLCLNWHENWIVRRICPSIKARFIMNKKDQKEILEIWQVLGLSLMYITGDKEEFFKTVKEELGYQWDGEGWRKVMQVH